MVYEQMSDCIIIIIIIIMTTVIVFRTRQEGLLLDAPEGTFRTVLRS